MDIEATHRFSEKENANRARLPRKNAARIEPCSIFGDSPKYFLVRIGPIADPTPLEENKIPTAIETAAGSDHSLLANKGIKVIIPPFMAMPDFNRARANTMRREVR